MKVVFAGPSVWGAEFDTSGLDMRGPAVAGDIAAAVDGGATTIGLIDGFFGQSAAVWHKEILYALSAGVTVYGAASMGALRAAELHSLGMIPVGSIAEDYISGALDDDAAVALLIAPAELSYMPLSEPLVDALATILQMAKAKDITIEEAGRLEMVANAMFFQNRTAESLVRQAFVNRAVQTRIQEAYESNRVFRKRDDALELIMQLNTAVPGRTGQSPFEPSAFWHLLDAN